jgi:hypothetical protein
MTIDIYSYRSIIVVHAIQQPQKAIGEIIQDCEGFVGVYHKLACLCVEAQESVAIVHFI